MRIGYDYFYNVYDIVVVQFILRSAEFEKYAVLVNLCILESFKLLEKCFKHIFIFIYIHIYSVATYVL